LTRQKRKPQLSLDIGAGTTDLIVVEDGEIQHVAVIGIGSSYITNDLAIGLKTDLDVAERVKLEHAQLGDAKKKTANVNIGGAHHSFLWMMVVMITEARVDEFI